MRRVRCGRIDAPARTRAGLAALALDARRLCRNKPDEWDQPMIPLHVQLADSTLRGVLKRLHYPLELLLVCGRWYAV